MEKVYYSDKANIDFNSLPTIKCFDCKNGVSYSEDLAFNSAGIETDVIRGEYSTKEFKELIAHLIIEHGFKFLDNIKLVAFCRKNSINYSRY
jgi:hypothetical protein